MFTLWALREMPASQYRNRKEAEALGNFGREIAKCQIDIIKRTTQRLRTVQGSETNR